MKPENILKGKIAENLIEEMLKKAGNKVYRFGSEEVLKNLIQSEKKLDRESDIGRKIGSLPDFIVISQSKKVPSSPPSLSHSESSVNEKAILVEVKFRTDPEALEEQLLLEKEYLEKFWEAKIILVTIKKPHFRVLAPPYFIKEKREGWPIPILSWQPIEADLDFGVKYPVLKNFEKLVEKHYSDKKPNPIRKAWPSNGVKKKPLT